ncbi:MAG TPA: hypothetical protein PK014_07550 [Thermoanaerobaculia bacterium]|nr:hypothetical protein [Thermoanaerobaculia bacterium]HUM29898.1 hypothetical protein [Thermoanaerobaculia bacterium]HXK68235.1 hypothetical protein [Thermoanaerobaculia bacterium]
MNTESSRIHKIIVLCAIFVVVALGSLLAARFIGGSEKTSEPDVYAGLMLPVPSPGQPAIPEPRVVDSLSLEIPCWSCQESQGWPVRFQTDLDVLAPLGTGTVNAALWLKEFTKDDGRRYGEMKEMTKRLILRKDHWGKVLPPDDPLLKEAEVWCDQAEMRFYPDIFPMEGLDSRLPNLLFPLTLARSWCARGADSSDDSSALEDFRRAIRIGRLLRQDDLFIINDLVGLACIHLGARGIYERAQKMGDSDLALLASVVLGEVAPQRLMTSDRITILDLSQYLDPDSNKKKMVRMTEGKVDDIIRTAKTSPDRRFRGEAILALHTLAERGSGDARTRARDTLKELTSVSDPLLASYAAQCLKTPITDDMFEDMLYAR